MHPGQLIQVFDDTVGRRHATRLQGGAAEPLYQPGDCESVIFFREDYISSALHEVAHWCIAGADRRAQSDYGYWYRANRNEPEQRSFERAEARPQALEWIMSEAAGTSFRVSCDSFSEATLDLPRFRRMVRVQVPGLLRRLPPRAVYFVNGLLAMTGRHEALRCGTYRELPG